MIIKDTYEATYPRYAFAPLVRAGIAVAALIAGRGVLKIGDKEPGNSVGGVLGSAA